MKMLTIKDKRYPVDKEGFLTDPEKWDSDFAEGLAHELRIGQVLSEKHWEVISFIRKTFHETGRVPLVYQACAAASLSLTDLKRLFPTGYLRGACKLAGLTYKEGFDHYNTPDAATNGKRSFKRTDEKIYRFDVHGFLVDPSEWDENLVLNKAAEMKIPAMAESHWKIIRFLRDYFSRTGMIPTIYETCESNNIDLDLLERLFPDGYQRGAVKLAGLRVR